MPFGDGRGPNGAGPMTGRGLGRCAGYSSPGYTRGYGRGLGRGYGRGFGRGAGFGRGYGWRNWQRFDYSYQSPLTPNEEKEALEDELNDLEKEADYVRERINNLKKEKK